MRTVALTLALVSLAACQSTTPESPSSPSTLSPPPPSSPSARPEPASPSPAPEAFDPDAVDLRLEPLVNGLDAPLLVTTAGDGSDRLFVVEQPGRIRIVRDGELEPEPFLDISDRLVSGGEQGLLGLAFHPRYVENGRFFVNYTDLRGDTVIAEFAVSADDPDRADPGSERVILGFDQPFANHNGGNLAFGPDGNLWIGTGDGGDAGDPFGNGQSLETYLGKMLRIDVDHRDKGLAYAIPPDNPFVGDPDALPEIWAYGLRNPWRYSFDRETGDLWIGDVGQNSYEEIDHVSSSKAGRNFGWNVMEGRECYQPLTGCDESGMTLPVAVYGHSQGCSVTGGFVYRGSEWPALLGAYLFSDYCSGTIWGLDASSLDADPSELLTLGRAISSFGQDDAGELYATDLLSGELLRVAAPAA
jgi:glucose/arabinose dehydrogenase